MSTAKPKPPGDPITILWLVEYAASAKAERVAASFGAKHKTPNLAHPAAAVALALGEGPVLAVVASDSEATRILGMGVDEVLQVADLETKAFKQALTRTRARARGRELRDFYLMDVFRRDDLHALEMLSSAVGHMLLGPMVHALDDSEVLIRELAPVSDGRESSAASVERAELRRRAQAIATTLRRATAVATNLDSLVDTAPYEDVVDARAIVFHASELMRPTIERTAELTIELPRLECPVAMPRWQLVQIITSTIANALDALIQAKRTGGKIEVRLLVHKDHHGEIAELHVADNGPGMDGSIRPRVMDPFFSTRGNERVGLGLSLARRRIHRAGGELLIDTEPGVGTRVQVFLPIRDVVQSGMAAECSS